MYEFGDAYEEDDNWEGRLREGEFDCIIIDAEKKRSKSDKPMIVISLEVEEDAYIKYYLVDDRSTPDASRWSNQRITRFFDCFNIPRGNFIIQTWKRKKGKVEIRKGKPNDEGVSYFEVKRLIVEKEEKKGKAEAAEKREHEEKREYEEKRKEAYDSEFKKSKSSFYSDDLDNIPF